MFTSLLQLLFFLQFFVRFLYFWIVGCVKALLPRGVLPRKSVRGKVVLITGSGSGLGRLLAVKFGKLGARLVLWDIDAKSNIETKEMLGEMGFEAYAYTVDLSDRQQIYKVANRVRLEVSFDVDILINNAGIVWGKTLLECPDDLIEKTMAVNATALFFTTKAFLPGMLTQNKGHIVNIASIAGLRGVSKLTDYCASKHAAIGFTESLRVDLAYQGCNGVQLTLICPCYVNTGMFEGVKTYSPLLFPIMEPDYVSDKIMEAILTNADELIMPWISHFYLAAKGILPTRALLSVCDYFGLDKTMDTFRGRH